MNVDMPLNKETVTDPQKGICKSESRAKEKVKEERMVKRKSVFGGA